MPAKRNNHGQCWPTNSSWRQQKNSFNQSQYKNLASVDQNIVSTDVGQNINDISQKNLTNVDQKNPNQHWKKKPVMVNTDWKPLVDVGQKILLTDID